MLTIYRGRESIDKEKFIYDAIRARRGEEGRTIVIVPDQYTLVAEKRAMELLGTDVLLDVEVTGFSRLGTGLMTENERNARTFIDRYGRHMLLTRILREKNDELKVYRDAQDKESFVSAIDDLISLIRQYELMPCELASGAAEGSALAEKLGDVEVIYEAYRAEISGKYTDREDLMEIFLDKVKDSELIADSSIWIYGFDSFFPGNVKMIGAMAARARDVNVFLTYDSECRDSDLFTLTGITAKRLTAAASDAGAGTRTVDVSGSLYARKDVPAGMKTLETELYSVSVRASKDNSGITLTSCKNMYNEAEAAAAHILKLLREDGLRLRDIVVICNDQTLRARAARRVFREYGLELFDDSKRGIMGSPVTIFLLSLLDIQAGGYRTRDVMRCLKTGLSPLTDEEVEKLEDYAVRYRINGSAWRKPFRYGLEEYGEEGFAHVEELRAKTAGMMEGLREIYRAGGTNRAFCAAYYDFLVNTGIADRIGELAESQEAEGLHDAAEETVQVWTLAMAALSQLSELMGDDEFSGREFIRIIKAGLSQMEVGVIPPVVDDILMGTMPRTIAGNVKALLVLGCNEGIIPSEPTENPLFSREELRAIAENGGDIGRMDELRKMEEDLSIYRSLSGTSRDLWLSWSVSDENGEEIRRSEIIDRICAIFPEIKIDYDPVESGDAGRFMGGRVNTLRHYTEAMRARKNGEATDPAWDVAAEWLDKVEDGRLAMIKEALAFDNSASPIPRELADELYLKRRDGTMRHDLSMSPSRLERFSRCPFSHFLSYGLRPEERRNFEVDLRDVGDIYHAVIMGVSRELTEKGEWLTIGIPELDALVDRMFGIAASELHEGVYGAGKSDEYKTERARRNCRLACRNLVAQYRAGDIKNSRFEVSFGRGGELAPIVRNFGSGTVYIEGKIDRLDVLADDRVKIIDYKTGQEKFNIDEARSGIRLQLMLYLKAAQENKARPAGVFYYLMSDPGFDCDKLTGGDSIDESMEKALRKHFRMNGIMISDESVVGEIDGTFEGRSDIIPVRETKDGSIKDSGGKFLLTEEEFAELQQDVDSVTDRLIGELTGGSIEKKPVISMTGSSPCEYCSYHGICRFDTAFSGNRYERVRTSAEEDG